MRFARIVFEITNIDPKKIGNLLTLVEHRGIKIENCFDSNSKSVQALFKILEKEKQAF